MRATPRYTESCIRLLDAVVEGRAAGVTSTAVVEETIHFELASQDERLRGMAGAAYAMFTPLLAVTDEVIQLALELDAPRIGANDRVHVATCRVHGVDTIVTADRGFDSIEALRRVDPLDTVAVGGLLD